MKKIKIKKELDHQRLEDLGYTYVMIEAGYMSKDGATIVSIDRSPYQREVMQYSRDEEKHIANVQKLREMDLLE